MESLLQKWGWIAHLVVIAIAAILGASAVTNYVAIQLAPYTVPELPKFAKPTSPSKARVQKPRAQSFAQSINDRCLFGCEAAPDPNACPQGCPDGQTCQAGACVAPDSQSASPETLVASDIGAKLLGAMVAADPDFSVALFSDPGARATYIVGVGDKLMGQAEVIDIRRDRVILKRNNRLEYIRLENSLSGAPTLTSTVANLPPGATDVKRTPPLVANSRLTAQRNQSEGEEQPEKDPKTKKVEEVAEGVFELDRSAVNAELDNAEKLTQAATIVPNYVNGKPAGVKLVGVRSDGVFQQLGIQSGDVVTSINGTKVKSQTHALELMQKLRSGASAEIEVERRGQSKLLKYKYK